MRGFVLLLVLTSCTQNFDAFLGDAGSAETGSDSTAPNDAISDVPSDAFSCGEPGAVLSAGHCYFELTTLQNATSAKNACAAVNAHLVTITGSAEQAVVAAIGPGDERWIGLFRTAGQPTDTNYAWLDGESRAGFSDWSAGEPNGTGMCVRMVAAGTWADDDCSSAHDAICERDP